jgi:putative transcriptional regulator
MDSAFLTGQMLIAMPAIGDARFERSLILLCAHDATHAMGVAINRPVEGLSVPDLLRRLDISAGKGVSDTPVLMGGPVEIERGFVVHTDDYRAEHTMPVSGGYALTATRDVLLAMAQPGAGPRRAVLALGYAGWSAGQLEGELRHNVWLTCEADEALVFDHDHASKWTRALAKLGVDPQFLTAEAGRA